MLTEREALSTYLQNQRRHIVHILDDLTDEQLLQPILPSGWSCAQLVNHLTWDVEHFWFQCVMAGNRDELDFDANAWDVPAGTSPTEIIAVYQRECQRADEIIATTDLDAAPKWWPVEIFPNLSEWSVREIILHVTTETATHAGHLDAVRELLDNRQWFVLT